MSIVHEVLEILKVKDKIVTKNLVGMDGRVKAVIQLLHMESDEVRVVGIHGIGGIGKTTLAKVVFNQIKPHFNHEHVVFLSDLRETSKHGLKHLQEQLLMNLQRKKSGDISDIDQGTRKIDNLLSGKRVLMILDDVDHMDQIDKLIPKECMTIDGKSRIIITTRDRRILTSLREIRSVKVEDFEMKEMEESESLQLFSNHAFKQLHPPVEYLDLAKEVICVVGKLPLALEVIGSYLYGRHQQEWRDKMRMLEKIPHKDVQKKLMISYESLELRTKQIFLDIACFFSGQEKTYPIYMWEACYLQPELGLEELTSKSLLKINDGNELWMHDRLKDLGREIVCLENVIDLGRRSRLWLPEEASIMSRRREGTRKVEALNVNLPYVRDEEFRSLRNLRFLECPGSTFAGDFRHMLSKLIWLSWKSCPCHFEATNLNLQSLVILELSGTDIDENWHGWTAIKIGNTLKVLDLTDCKSLRRTPDLSNYKKLERLILDGCEWLVEINRSIGELKKLKYLSMHNCESLMGFPDEICYLDCLEGIVVSGFHKRFETPFTLPASIGNLRSLKILKLESLGIDHVPESIGELVMLQSLSFCCCNRINKLPGSLEKLKSLTELNLAGTGVSELPDSIGELEDLEELNIMGTRVSGLPSLVKLSKLKLLNLDNCENLVQLPLQLPSSLTRLLVKSESLVSLPADLSNLHNLIDLKIVAGWQLEQDADLDWITKLTRLISLNLKLLPFRCSPPDFCSLSRLEQLTFHVHDIVENGSTLLLPPTLSHLDLGFNDETELPCLSRLKNLHSLELRGFLIEDGMADLGICSSSNSLRHLRIQDCYFKEPLALISLHVQEHDQCNASPPNLALEISCCYYLERLDYVSKLVNLGYLNLASCYKLNRVYLPTTLLMLEIHECNSLIELTNLSQLLNLHRFELRACQKIVEIPGLGELKNLKYLYIHECSSLERLDDLSKLVKLQSLHLDGCGKLRFVQGIDKHKLKECKLQVSVHPDTYLHLTVGS